MTKTGKKTYETEESSLTMYVNTEGKTIDEVNSSGTSLNSSQQFYEL